MAFMVNAGNGIIQGTPKSNLKGTLGGPFLREKGDPWRDPFVRKRGLLGFFVNRCKQRFYQRFKGSLKKNYGLSPTYLKTPPAPP